MSAEPIEVRRRDQGIRAMARWSYRPPIDVFESNDEITVIANLPGVARDDVEVSYEKGTLEIHGHVALRQERDVHFLVHEYGVGDFDREVTFGDIIDAEKLGAEMKRGVLTVRLPKSERVKPRRIPVRSA